MTASIRAIAPSEYEIARELLATNGWAHRVADKVRFRELLDNSNIALVALEDQRIVGFIRAISDQISNGYISMLVVHPELRRKGIGRSLVDAAMQCAAPSVTWVLRAGRIGAPEFFAALGFRHSTEAMELKRPSI